MSFDDVTVFQVHNIEYFLFCIDFLLLFFQNCIHAGLIEGILGTCGCIDDNGDQATENVEDYPASADAGGNSIDLRLVTLFPEFDRVVLVAFEIDFAWRDPNLCTVDPYFSCPGARVKVNRLTRALEDGSTAIEQEDEKSYETEESPNVVELLDCNVPYNV